MAALSDTLRTVGSSAGATTFGTALTAGSQIGAGIAERRAASAMAAEADVAAGQQQAASQRTAYDQQRRGELAVSRARAVAAASGGGATDSTVTDIVGRIAGEAAYRSQLALYEGNDAARQLQERADMLRYGGRRAQVAGITRAFSTVLSGAKTLSDKYGGGPRSSLSSSDIGGVAPYYDPTGWGMS